jgi:REP element-mobilizing transposase RayT
MSTKKEKYNKNTFYFCTITCFEWIPLFDITGLYDHIYKWFKILKSKKVYIVGYVIMPNHFHFIAYYPETKVNINSIIGTGKRFMAYEIVKRLKELKRFDLLLKLKNSVKDTDKKRNKLHQVFQPSFDLKELSTDKYVIQKLNYIHKNPISGKYNLVDDYVSYNHSSAGFYELGQQGAFKVTHYLEVKDLIESNVKAESPKNGRLC